MKLNHKAASDFTFIMAVPIMLAASGLSLLKHYQDIQIADIPFYILGFLAAFTVGLIAIKTFLHLINKNQINSICHLQNCISNLYCYTFTSDLALVKVFNFLLKYRLSIKEPLDWQFIVFFEKTSEILISDSLLSSFILISGYVKINKVIMEARSMDKKKVIKFMISVLPIVLVPLIVERKRIKQHPDVQKLQMLQVKLFHKTSAAISNTASDVKEYVGDKNKILKISVNLKVC